MIPVIISFNFMSRVEDCPASFFLFFIFIFFHPFPHIFSLSLALWRIVTFSGIEAHRERVGRMV